MTSLHYSNVYAKSPHGDGTNTIVMQKTWIDTTERKNRLLDTTDVYTYK